MHPDDLTSYHARDLVRCSACGSAKLAMSDHMTRHRCGGAHFQRLAFRTQDGPEAPPVLRGVSPLVQWPPPGGRP